MRRAHGYARWDGPGGGLTAEADTITCCHCNTVVIVPAGKDSPAATGFCRLCMDHTCGPCGAMGKCTPFEKRLKSMEDRAKLARAVGVVSLTLIVATCPRPTPQIIALRDAVLIDSGNPARSSASSRPEAQDLNGSASCPT